MKILITGGSGFVGKNLIEYLQGYGHEIVNYDLKNDLKSAPFIEGDLLDIATLTKALKGIDVVCHLAGVGDVYLAFEKPSFAALCNVVGTANLYEAALANNVKKVVYTSTWEVYGEPHYLPLDENHPTNPEHSYSITKLAGERLALFYEKHKGVKTVVLRLGTVYGKRMRPNSVFPIFINKALMKEEISIQGEGIQFRQFTHALDIAEAFRLAIESDVSGEIFNIVSPEKISIKQLAEMVVDRLPTKIAFTPSRKGDVPSASVSSERAKDILGWEPKIEFRQGLMDLIDFYKVL